MRADREETNYKAGFFWFLSEHITLLVKGQDDFPPIRDIIPDSHFFLVERTLPTKGRPVMLLGSTRPNCFLARRLFDKLVRQHSTSLTRSFSISVFDTVTVVFSQEKQMLTKVGRTKRGT